MQAATYVKMQTTHKMPVLAQGAGETGMAEAYMCSRIMRDPLVRQGIAEYQGEFEAEETDGGFTRGTQWLVWKFESDSTLGDAMQVRACVCTCLCAIIRGLRMLLMQRPFALPWCSTLSKSTKDALP